MPPLPIIFFAASLLFLSMFFALKEREAYRGSTTFMTRLLVRHSPLAERLWLALLGILLRHAERLLIVLSTSLLRIVERTVASLRYLVVLTAEKMIKGVRGERLLSGNGTPSVYLKHLKDHQETNSDESGTVAE